MCVMLHLKGVSVTVQGCGSTPTSTFTLLTGDFDGSLLVCSDVLGGKEVQLNAECLASRPVNDPFVCR